MTDTVVLEKLPANLGSVSSGSGDYQRRRIYIFATGQGMFFAFLLLVMLVLAINYSNSMAYVMTFLLGSLLMISMLHTYRNLRGLIIGSQAASPVFAGDILSYPLLIDNRAGQKRVAITIEAVAKKGKKSRPGNIFEPLTVNPPAGNLTRNNLLIRQIQRYTG